MRRRPLWLPPCRNPPTHQQALPFLRQLHEWPWQQSHGPESWRRKEMIVTLAHYTQSPWAHCPGGEKELVYDNTPHCLRCKNYSWPKGSWEQNDGLDHWGLPIRILGKVKKFPLCKRIQEVGLLLTTNISLYKNIMMHMVSCVRQDLSTIFSDCRSHDLSRFVIYLINKG